MSNRRHIVLLSLIGVLFIALSVCGITWGLPGRGIDKYLFGDGPVWSGERIYQLADAAEKFDKDRGADVDADPVSTLSDEPVLLTGSEEDIARIYLRYRLYTHQPDEMIAMMALAGMNPRAFDFDPRLYQYGGMFLYPVGALIYAGNLLGLINVRSDVVYYLDHPEEFGKFYMVARAYAAAWGLIGVWIVFAIGRRLGGTRAGLLTALLFTLMPVVICMAHEGKPHLPGAVLMLSAVLFAMRYADPRAASLSLRGVTHGRGILAVQESSHRRSSEDQTDVQHSTGRHTDWWLMCICCGASFGMVLSSWPIFILIPLVAWNSRSARAAHRASSGEKARGLKPAARRAVGGIAVAIGVYLLSNPYVPINAFAHRDVLASNFGNSLAMYEIARIIEGVQRVAELTIEGASLIVVVFGAIALVAAIRLRLRAAVPLIVPAVLFFAQFVLIGAGKPAEYGRFGIFPDAALAIGTACVVTMGWQKRYRWMPWVAMAFVTLIAGTHGLRYLWNFRIDAKNDNSRTRIARILSDASQARGSPDDAIVLLADPAPYGCPPMDFAHRDVYILRRRDQLPSVLVDRPCVLMEPVDRREWTTGAPFSTAPGQESPSRTGEDSFFRNWPGDTPISWANKPFRISRRDSGDEHWIDVCSGSE